MKPVALPQVPANLLHHGSFWHHPKMPILVKTTFIGLIRGVFILNWSILSSKEKPLRRWLTFAQLSWVNQERFVQKSGTIWETGSTVHPSQHEWPEANPDHPAPPISKPNTGGIMERADEADFPPTYPCYYCCYKTQDVPLLRPFFSLRQWGHSLESLWLSLSNHRGWMPY